MTKKSALIFPNQLFSQHPALVESSMLVYLLEDELFFGDRSYPFKPHQQKLQLHFASLDYYQDCLQDQGYQVARVAYDTTKPAIHRAFATMQEHQISELNLLDPVDFLLQQRLEQASLQFSIKLVWHKNPGFINTRRLNQQYRSGKKRWFMADFYQWQRKRLNILMEDNKPAGGSWSFDQDNRKKVPKAKLADVPDLELAVQTEYHQAAIQRVQREFSSYPGNGRKIIYPVTHAQAQAWLTNFFTQRFADFGAYEDAIVAEQHWLYHGVLTPMLNIGLLTPQQVVTQALEYAPQHSVPLNSLEGFVRQIIGWREFMRATYDDLGVRMRTSNHWQHIRIIPASFYQGSTGIDPIDDVIKKVLKTGYCHHIERLMIIGSFFFLCEFAPDEIYRWFMDLFIDSYDWVMVPNVYAMSQHADGGLITTKPYFCGSNYIIKMSHYKKGEWSEVWDALYWRWVLKHSPALVQNPRWAMMCRQADKMPKEKKQRYLNTANHYLLGLDNTKE